MRNIFKKVVASFLSVAVLSTMGLTAFAADTIEMPDETSFVTAGIDAQTVSQDVSVMAENQAPVADLRVTVLNPDSMVNGNFTTETQIAWLWSYNGENFTYDPDGDAITNMSIGGISNSDLVGTFAW